MATKRKMSFYKTNSKSFHIKQKFGTYTSGGEGERSTYNVLFCD